MIADNIDKKNAAQSFYKEALEILIESKQPFLLGGAFAFNNYTQIFRDTKDLDVFCKPSDYLRILKVFSDKGYKIEVTDARWLAKVFMGENFIDIIFDTVNNICRVDDTWFEYSVAGELYGIEVRFISAEELIWCKTYVQNRERFDGADINHVIIKYGHKIDWKRVLFRLDQHWQLLLAIVVVFQFVYPSDREIIPKWLYDELLRRARELYELPPAIEKVCRGPIIDQTQYKTDITDWAYKVVTIKTI